MTTILNLSPSETFTVERPRSVVRRIQKTRPESSVDLPAIERAVRMILEAVGEDPDREGLLETPRRVAKMYAEMFFGLTQDPARHLRVTFPENYDEMVLVRDIRFTADAAAFADSVAERIAALGGQSEGTINVVGRRTTLPAYPVEIVAGRDHVDALSTSMAVVGKSIRGSIGRAVELDDADTADLFTEVSRELAKKLWFVESHLHGNS